jgi:hypothetical protein
MGRVSFITFSGLYEVFFKKKVVLQELVITQWEPRGGVFNQVILLIMIFFGFHGENWQENLVDSHLNFDLIVNINSYHIIEASSCLSID